MLRKIQVNVAGVSASVYENLLTKKANGDYEKHYNADMSLDMDTINAEAIQKMIADGEALVESHVQVEIDKYNEEHGVHFTDVDSCHKYTGQDGYIHQQFCVDIVAYNTSCWEKARIAQQDGVVTMNTTAEEFLAVLPAFGA